MQQRLVEAGHLKGKTIAIDVTTLESQHRRREARATRRFWRVSRGLGDRDAHARASNTDWTDPDAKVTKMKDGRTHLAHKAEHAWRPARLSR